MKVAAIAAGLALVPAASPGAAAARKGDQSHDPDSQVCKSRPVVGSRVKRVRTCMTAQQWEEQKLQEQLGMMRRQTNGDAGCNWDTGMPTCGVQNGGRDRPF